MAWIPPYVAQVPAATMAVALGASRSSHSLVVIGCPVAGLFSKPDQYPSSLIFSFGTDPSTNRTNGSRSPRSALKNHSRKSSAPPLGPHSKSINGQWTAICGRPGSAPRAISSMLGWVAAVSETESPSQLRPALIHSTWMRVSSAFLASSVSMGRPPFRRVPFSDHRPPYLPAAGPFLAESGIPRFPDFSLADLLPDRLTVAAMHELAIAESVLSTITARV